jgi:urease accessory protein
MSSRTSRTALELIPSSAGYGTTCFSSPDRVGRDGYLSLEFERHRNLTAMTRSRFRLPLQVLKPSYLEDDGSAFVLMLNPTGGVVGGDSLKTEIRLGSRSHVCLSTPSATTVYRTLNRPAGHDTSIQLEEEAILEYFPEHLIPYPGSALRQSIRIRMAPGSCLILNESFAAGRIARNEQWKFKELSSDTEVHLGGSPVYIGKSRIVPTEMLPHRLGYAENFNYFANLLVVWEEFSVWKKLVDELSAVLNSVPGVHAGASCGARSSCVVRVMTSTAAQLTHATQTVWGCLRTKVLKRPAISARKY